MQLIKDVLYYCIGLLIGWVAMVLGICLMIILMFAPVTRRYLLRRFRI